MTPRHFIREIIVRLVLPDRPAKGHARLHSCVGWIAGRTKGVYRLEISVADVAVNVPMEIVRPRSGDDIDHPTRCTTVLGCITVGQDLKFLHRLLRHGGTYAVCAVVDCVRTIHIHQVGAPTLTTHVEPGCGSGANRRRVVANHLRIRQSKIDVITPIDRQVIDAALVDRIGS